MCKRKRNKRFRVNAKHYDAEKVVKSMTELYRPIRKLPEATPELRYTTKKEKE